MIQNREILYSAIGDNEKMILFSSDIVKLNNIEFQLDVHLYKRYRRADVYMTVLFNNPRLNAVIDIFESLELLHDIIQSQIILFKADWFKIISAHIGSMKEKGFNILFMPLIMPNIHKNPFYVEFSPKNSIRLQDNAIKNLLNDVNKLSFRRTFISEIYGYYEAVIQINEYVGIAFNLTIDISFNYPQVRSFRPGLKVNRIEALVPNLYYYYDIIDFGKKVFDKCIEYPERFSDINLQVEIPI